MSDFFYNLRIPTLSTMNRYGLTVPGWSELVERTMLKNEAGNFVCPVCLNEPKDGKTVIDHEHVAKWKKMLPSERKKFVRGIVCAGCNYFILGRQLTWSKAAGAASYLGAYEARKHGDTRLRAS